MTATAAPSELAFGMTRRRSWLAGSAATGAGAMAAGALLLIALSRSRPVPDGGNGSADVPARRLFQGAAILSFTVLADSALEHYRARFRNPAMIVAPTVAALALGASIHALVRPQQQDRLKSAVYGGAVVAGLIGSGFHIYNIGKREGGYGWLNFFYAAPLGAPAALSLSGLFGLAGQWVGAPQDGSARTKRRDAGAVLAGAAAVGLAGTAAEVALLHFRGSFQNPFMYAPVSIPPVAAAATAVAAFRPSASSIAAAEALLKTSALLGFAGLGFHSYGIHRNMGGWRNSSQMLLQGPPLPAPLGFTGTAIAGLAALSLLKDQSR